MRRTRPSESIWPVEPLSLRALVVPGEPVLLQPKCAAINCPLHTKQPAEPPARRRSPTIRGAGSGVEIGAPSPRRSKLEVANERNRKLLANSSEEK